MVGYSAACSSNSPFPASTLARQRQDVVARPDHRLPVGDREDRRLVLLRPQLVHDRGLGLGVERRAGLVEEQELRIGIERPGDRDALPLAARELQPALADLGLVALRQALDEPRDRRPLGTPA